MGSGRKGTKMEEGTGMEEGKEMGKDEEEMGRE
jgi:hypothetical protein